MPAATAVSVVMPAHNEQGWIAPSVEAVITALGRRGAPFEVVIAENGSTDATAAEAEHLAASHPQVRVLRSPLADYGQALRDGLLAATGEVVVNVDVDLVDPAFLDRALDAFEADPTLGMVIGSKRGRGSEDRRSLARRAITGVFSLLLRAGFGLRVTDTHGLKAFRREQLAPIAEACRFGKDIYDTELVLRAERAGVAITEIPIAVRELRPARSSIGRRIPRSLLALARLRLLLWRERALEPSPRS